MEPNCPEYDELPEAIKACVTLKDYLNMGDKGRRELMQDMTCPEPEDEWLPPYPVNPATT